MLTPCSQLYYYSSGLRAVGSLFDHQPFIAACLEGFTQDLPPTDQFSQFTTNSITPDSDVVFTGVKFLCSGTLEELHVPFELRGSDYQFWDRSVDIDLTIWRPSRARLVKVETMSARVRIDRLPIDRILAMIGRTIMLNESEVVPITETFEDNIVIMEGDLVGVVVPETSLQVLNISGHEEMESVAEHLPLLLDSDTQVPVMKAIFSPSTPPTSEG